jgi:hypothetical protein
MATLAKLLDRAARDSAEHRAIQEELRRREINSAPDTETHLLFTAEEWSRTLQRVTFTTTERASPLTTSACHGTA